MKKLQTPLTKDTVKNLKAGDEILLSGTIYTARDAAHERLAKLIESGQSIPVDLTDQVIYYAGPCPAKPGEVIGSCGPTSACRMDKYAPIMYENGLSASIGKGIIGQNVVDSMKKNGCVFFVAIGGLGALIKKCIKKAEIIAFEDLGPEAIYKLEVENFPLFVGTDSFGNTIYK